MAHAGKDDAEGLATCSLGSMRLIQHAVLAAAVAGDLEEGATRVNLRRFGQDSLDVMAE